MFRIYLGLLISSTLFISSCQNKDESPSGQHASDADVQPIKADLLNFDEVLAYNYIDTQVAFGPRKPGSRGHQECALWLVKTLSELSDTAYVQEFDAITLLQQGYENVIGITVGAGTLKSEWYDQLVLKGNGFVGVNVAAPSYRLEVNGTNGSIAVSGSGYTLNPVPMLIGQYTSTRGYIQVPNQGSFEIWNGGTSTIAEFKNNSQSIFYGSVGIGTSPATNLHISGANAILRVQ
jgi:hypothetical protein